MPSPFATKLAISASFIGVFVTSSFADVVLFQRGLPVQNLNNAAGLNRSNVGPLNGDFGPGFGGPYILGDDFSLPTSSVIHNLSVWVIGNALNSAPVAPTTEFTSITLYGGNDQTALTALSSAYTATRVQYTGGLDFQSTTNGFFYPIYQITFSGLTWNVFGNTLYNFAIGAVPVGNNTLALHASNAALSGGTQTGADNSFLFFLNNPPIATFASDASSVFNFPKGADANVLIAGAVVITPEPSTLGLLALGASSILLRRLKRS